MAKAGKHYHWKHGWIPLDAFARSKVKGRRDLTLTVDEKRAELNKRRAARGEAPLLPRPRTRKPPNFVPAKDNVSTVKPLTAAQQKKLIAKELAKSPATIRAEEKKATDARLLKKNFSDMTPAEKIRAAEIMYGKGSPKAIEARKIYAAVDVSGVAVDKNSAGVFHVKDGNGKVIFRSADPITTMDWLTRNGMDPKTAKAHVRTAQSAADYRREAYRKVDTVDGVDFVSYRSASMDPLGSDHGQPWEMDEAQKKTVADAYNEVRAEFPGMEPVQFVAVQGKEGILGITTWDGRRISMSKNAFSDADRKLAARNFGKHGAIAGQFTDDPEAFARAVVVHELGHAMEMQTAETKRRGDRLALELVTPADVGIDTSGWAPDAAKEKTQRWQVDTLNHQTVYGLGNQYEWFAEAFAEGWFSGDNATPEGKRAVGILKDAYGKVAA